jgi:putative chitinase
MSLEEKLNIILPPIDNIHMHITGEFGEPRPNGKTHQGIDFNYIGGQKGINLMHPNIYSPIEGEVTFVKGNFGTIKIKDSEGVSHELLHTHTQVVKLGEVVNVGDLLGTMGGKGPLGHYQYPQHVHYQIKDANGSIVNPHFFWKKRIKQKVTLIHK